MELLSFTDDMLVEIAMWILEREDYHSFPLINKRFSVIAGKITDRKKKQFNRWRFTYNSDGKKVEEHQIKLNGIADGLCNRFVDGILYESVIFKNGILHGECNRYNMDGFKEEKFYYNKGAIDGPYFYYNLNTGLRSEVLKAELWERGKKLDGESYNYKVKSKFKIISSCKGKSKSKSCKKTSPTKGKSKSCKKTSLCNDNDSEDSYNSCNDSYSSSD